MPRLIDLIAEMKSEEAVTLIPTLSSDEIKKKFSSQGYELYTALHLAALLGLDHVVKSLIDHGANVRARDGMDRVPMHYAAEPSDFAETQSKLRIIRHLHHAESYLIFDTDKELNTPLHIAAMYGETDFVRELLALGSSSSIKNKEGFIPRELVPTEKVELVQLLKSNELSLTSIALRSAKELPREAQRAFMEKLPEPLLARYVVLDEPSPRLAVWCFNQAREQEEARSLLAETKDTSVDEITKSLSTVSLGL